jgi:hypothetical protein
MELRHGNGSLLGVSSLWTYKWQSDDYYTPRNSLITFLSHIVWPAWGVYVKLLSKLNVHTVILTKH